MVNLHYDFASICIFGVILFSMISRRVIKSSTNRVFFVLLVLSYFATVADILSEWHCICTTVRYVMDYFYFALALVIPLTYSIYIYQSVGLSSYLKSHKRIWIWLSSPLIIFFILIISNAFTHCAFYVTENGDYVRGPCQPLLILCILLYILAGISIIIRWSKIIPRDKFIALLSFFPIMTAALIAQQFNQGLEMTMFGLAVSELIISFTVQRNDENYDKSSGTKTLESAIEDFQKVFLTKVKVRVIYIKIKNNNSIRRFLGTTNYNQFLKVMSTEIAAILKKVMNLTEIYYVDEGIFALKIATTNMDLVTEMANSIADRLKRMIIVDDIPVGVEARICIVRIPEDVDNLDSLMNFRFNFHKKLPDTTEVMMLSDFMHSKEFKIKNELDEIISHALKNHYFQMYYQPIYSTKEKKFTSAEALLRLNDPRYGFVSPAVFIPAAETSGAIHQIGDYVIESVCQFIASNDFKELGLKYVELNLSVAQCIESDLVEKIEETMKKYKVNPEQLNLEITETADDIDQGIMDFNINRLYQRGFRFSLDDYGTGYSNIKRVTNLPLDIVKLDKSFVDEMDNPQMWSVIVNTVNMFKEMNKIILVEGVEDKEKLDSLTELGCDYIQGFYFSKPLPENEFVEFLVEKNK